MKAAISVRNLDKKFGSFHAVKKVTFEAEEGKITALLGPSGSGKSTVLRTIAGLERADGGHIFLGGEEHTYNSVQERRVGFVFQHYALFRHMTVAQNVAFGLSVRRMSKHVQGRRVDELLKLVQLHAFADRYPDQLSGGQRQRVALARALAPKPQVLLLDEPFGALDARVRIELRRWIDDLHRELGVTSLLVTHDQEEALELANKVVVMHEGAVEQIGSPDEVYNRPASPFVAGFVGAANVINGFVISGRVQFGEAFVAGAAHLIDGTVAQAYIRPHDIRISRRPLDGLSSSAIVERLNNLGWMSKLQLVMRDGQTLIAHLPNEELGGVALGQEVHLDLRNAKVFSSGAVTANHSDELAAV